MFPRKIPENKVPKKCSHLSFLVVEDGLDVGADAERVVVIEDQTFGWQVGSGATSEDLNKATLFCCFSTLFDNVGTYKPSCHAK